MADVHLNLFIGGEEFDENALTKTVVYADKLSGSLASHSTIYTPPVDDVREGFQLLKELDRECRGEVTRIVVPVSRLNIEAVADCLCETEAIELEARVETGGSWRRTVRGYIGLLRSLNEEWGLQPRFRLGFNSSIETEKDYLVAETTFFEDLDPEQDVMDEISSKAPEAYGFAMDVCRKAADELGVVCGGINPRVRGGARHTFTLVLEAFKGDALYRAGTLAALIELAETCYRLAGHVKRLGGPSAYLDYSCDWHLHAYVVDGLVNVRDLLLLASGPLNEVDVIPMPSSIDDRLLEALLADFIYATSWLNGFEASFILVDAEPSERVQVGGMEMPVLSPGPP